MGLSIIVLAAVIGLGVVVMLVMVVMIVALSRREDFINPFSSSKPTRERSTKEPKVDSPRMAPPLIGEEEAALVDWLLDQASEQTGVNLKGDPMAVERIANAARLARQELEEQESTLISLPFLTADGSGPKHFELTLTRNMLDQLR